MDEIAIAREITFREVGEGTGLSKDTDKFDPHYRHLFLWDKANAKVVGVTESVSLMILLLSTV